MKHGPTILILTLLGAAAALNAVEPGSAVQRDQRTALLASVGSHEAGDLDARALRKILDRGLLGRDVDDSTLDDPAETSTPTLDECDDEHLMQVEIASAFDRLRSE
ncbi:hypothetical protein [Engelhardtia mirabilis]|uniref:hypothetical protein n=1 Tax=Engelhardtia mirabilis TaxID=2528011 RepID=UPI00119F8EF2